MNSEIKTEWVERLRSGNYEQCEGWLRVESDTDMFCCLGVLCEIAVDKSVLKPPTKGDDGVYKYTVNGYSNTATLPEGVAEWAGLKNDGELSNILIAMNDAKHNNFSEIADYIEENA